MRLRNIPRAESVLSASPLVIRNEASCRGNWAEKIFKNTNPVHLEIGMGKGQFLLSLARRFPDINYIGIERYSSVLLRAVEKLERPDFTEPPSNIRFICMDAADIRDVFSAGEIGLIYLNFSDPWPKARHARRRLTSSEYFAKYNDILAPDGQVEFKTDNRTLFDFSVDTINQSPIWSLALCTYDLHHDKTANAGNIMTEYEEKFSSANNPICKLIAKRQSDCHSCI